MLTNTQTIRRVTVALALTASIAALVTSPAFAGNSSRYGPLDPWALSYFASHPKAAALLNRHAPNTNNAAPGLVATQLGSPDPRDSTAASADTSPDPGLVPTQLGSPDPRDTSLAGSTASSTIGFQWADFGVGIAAAVGFMLLLAASTRLLAVHRGRKQQHPVATA